MVGPIGHLFLLVSFLACGFAVWSYYRAADTRKMPEKEREHWLLRGRKAWILSFAAVASASVLLWLLILTHQFQYSYVYSYTSRDLPLFYVVSAFWAGQEGSFLLWILFNAVAGLVLVRRARAFEAPVMALVALCQFFLLSMVVGVRLGAFSLGVSPFLPLAEKYPDAEMLQQPGFVPADGQGLNDLLQNPWMVIHPPVLFVGFAVMLVPFAYAVAGLWHRRYTEWVRPALPWALFANLALMAGIALGGYWAYVTLSFGGYWAWDPVENSSLVPWLISVGALHTMITMRTSGTSFRAAFVLNIAAFLLVVYSTFLTRSGILGETSVHSFVDLGLYNQLLVWILALAGVGVALFVRRYRELPVPQREVNPLSREFLLFSGAMVLCAVGVVILVGTSAPILGSLFRDNPSAVAIAFYNKWTLPLVTVLALLAGMAPLFWWKKMTREQVSDVLFQPMAFSTVATVAVLLFTPFVQEVVQPVAQAAGAGAGAMTAGLGGLGATWQSYGAGLLLLLLVFSAFFALYGNGIVLWKIGRGNPRMAGGALSHVGLVLMLFGIVTSSIFDNPLSDGSGGKREVFVIDQGVPSVVEGYTVEYTGQEVTPQGRTVHHLSFTDAAGRRFDVRPVTYRNNRDQWVQNPDTRHFFSKDVYVAVSPSAMFEEKGSQPGQVDLVQGDTVTVGDAFLLRFDRFDMSGAGAMAGTGGHGAADTTGIAVAALVQVTNLKTGETKTLSPVYRMGHDRHVTYAKAEAPEWGLALSLVGMQVDGGAVRLAVEGVDLPTREWLVVQAHEKPFINLLWLGLTVMLAGFALATYRRLLEQRTRETHAPKAVAA